MKGLNSTILLFILLALGGCLNNAANPVKIETRGISSPADILLDEDVIQSSVDLGEYVRGSGAKYYKLKIKNNTRFPLRNLNLRFVDSGVNNFAFDQSEGGANEFPGDTGTCSARELAPMASCEVALQFSSLVSALVKQKFKLTYKNMIEEVERDIEAQVLSGTRASLVFVPDTTNYAFGNPTGNAGTPLVERSIRLARRKTLTVKNAGELSARSVSATLDQSCESKASGLCPEGQGSAFTLISNNCPETLYGEDSCKIEVEFINKNQGDDADLAHVSYEGIYNFTYLKDPIGTPGALTAYFDSTSTEIKAAFETSNSIIAFSEEVNAGNRSKQSIRIKNSGFREGILKRILVYEKDSSDIEFYCEKSDQDYLRCFTPDDVAASLEKIPLFFEDVDDCMNTAGDKLISVDQSCVFDIHFQPSVNFTSNGSFDYDLRLQYDELYQGQESIVTSDEVDLNVSGSWKSRARLAWQDIRVGNGDWASFSNEAKVSGLSSTMSLSENTFYTLGTSGQIPLGLDHFVDLCGPQYNEDGVETGTPVLFSNTASGSIQGRLYSNYQGQGRGILIDSGASGSVQNGSVLTFNSCMDGSWTSLGRIAAQLFDFYQRERVTLRFVNNGGVGASSISLTDGAGTVVPPGVATNIGFSSNTCSSSTSDGCPFYSAVSYSCSTLAASTGSGTFSCSISFDFSPVKRENDSQAQSLASLFDSQSSNLDSNYKSWVLSYDDGTLYSDSNISSDTADRGAQTLEARIGAYLVNKGKLSDMTVTVPPDGNSVSGESAIQTVTFRNIGTGDIPYIFNDGMWFGTNFDMVSTSNIPSGEFDCLDFIDATVGGTGTSPGAFLSGDVCHLSFQFQWINIDKQPPQVLYGPNFMEINRLFNQSLTNDELWEFGPMPAVTPTVWLGYYDGDITNPDRTGNYSNTFGQEYSFNDSLDPFSFLSAPHIIPTALKPVEKAVMARPAFNKATLMVQAPPPMGPFPLFPGTTINRTWFYNQESYHLFENDAVMRSAFDNDDALFSYEAIARGKTELPDTCSDCDYYIHFGAFRSGESAELGFSLANLGGAFGVVESLGLSNDSSDRFSLSAASQLNDAQINGGNSESIDITFNPQASDTGTFRAVLEYSVNSQIASDGVNLPNKVWDYKIEIIAEVSNSYPELSFNYQTFDVQTQAGQAPTESLNSDSASITSGFGLEAPDDSAGNKIILEMIQREDAQDITDAGYVKTRLFVNANASGAQNVQAFLKMAAGDTQRTQLSSLRGLSITNNCDGINLGANGSCSVDFTYQPNQFSSARDFIFTLAYELDDGLYEYQNISVRLAPREPGTIRPVANQYRQTFGGLDALSDSDAMALDFGDSTYDSVGKLIEFPAIALENSSGDLRASLLRSYHIKNNISDTSVYPADNEYTTISGKDYVSIYETQYPDNSERIKVLASKECIYGELFPDDPQFGDVAENARGFLGNGYEECALKVSLRLNANYINLDLHNRQPASIMGDNYFRLFYYSYERLETNVMSFYFRGQVKPDQYQANDGFFEVFADDGANISFRFNEVAETNTSVGQVSGYRIFYGDTPNALENVLKDGGNFLSQGISSDGQIVDVNTSSIDISSLSNGKAIYFKVLAIRNNANYTRGDFQGLAAGEYLAEGDLPILRVVVPFTDHAYLHSENAFVQKDAVRSGGNLRGPLNYAQAAQACADLGSADIDDLASPNATKDYSLITPDIWNGLRAFPSMSFYTGAENYLAVPHWLDGGAFDISTVFDNISGINFDPSLVSQTFPTQQLYYFHCTDGCSADRMIGGGFYGETFQDYTSYAGESLSLGHARCYLDVSP